MPPRRSRKRPLDVSADTEPPPVKQGTPDCAAGIAEAPPRNYSAPPNTSTVMTWNVASLRSMCRPPSAGEALRALVREHRPELLFLQETKLQHDHVPEYSALLQEEGYAHSYWHCSTAKKGYSGTALLARSKPAEVKMGLIDSPLDAEGRVITAHYPKCVVVGVYVPNSGQKLKRLQYRCGEWEPAMRAHLATLRRENPTVPIILCGDLNVAPHPIDIHDPKRNVKNAGFTPEEREQFAQLLGHGERWVDAFRWLYPDAKDRYTYWSGAGRRAPGAPTCRDRNMGWRIDHVVVSAKEVESGVVVDCRILDGHRGSDHCPVALDVRGEDMFG